MWTREHSGIWLLWSAFSKASRLKKCSAWFGFTCNTTCVRKAASYHEVLSLIFTGPWFVRLSPFVPIEIKLWDVVSHPLMFFLLIKAKVRIVSNTSICLCFTCWSDCPLWHILQRTEPPPPPPPHPSLNETCIWLTASHQCDISLDIMA